MTVAPDGTNSSVADLVADIQSAVDIALMGMSFNAGDVVVKQSGLDESDAGVVRLEGPFVASNSANG